MSINTISNQGIAGTPYNHTTYHQRLRYNRYTSLGTDGYLGRVIRDKMLSVKTADYVDCTQFVNSILSNSIARERCRAIIDINATFQSCARRLLRCCKNHCKLHSNLSKPIQYPNQTCVIFWWEPGIICSHLDTPGKIITLGTSDTDEINQRLNSTPDERFTFYDHGHKTGTDITQRWNGACYSPCWW